MRARHMGWILLLLCHLSFGCGGPAVPPAETPDEGDDVGPVKETKPEGEEGIIVQTVVLDGCSQEDGILAGTACCISPAYALKPYTPEHVITTQEQYGEMIAAVEALLSKDGGEGDGREDGSCTYPDIDFEQHSLLMMMTSNQPFCQRKDVTKRVVADEQEQKYVFTVTAYGTGYCKKKHRAWWVMVLVPALPEGWDVEFVKETVHVDQ